jgi:serine/threonine protein kinase
MKCAVCGAGLVNDICPKCLYEQAMSDASPEFDAIELKGEFAGLTLEERIGQGGMGVVFRAQQTQLGRHVALKILPRRLAEDPAFVERFEREARALGKLNHANIVTVHDFGMHQGYLYFVMEYVDGLTLRQLMKAGKLPPVEALKIVPQLCDALEYAHSEGIVHRDIKPENIMVDKRGRVKVTDFGIAKIVDRKASTITEANSVIGTPQYMAPEQIETPRDVDHRADIYALGVVIYEMLTGELPMGKFDPPSKRAGVDVRLDPVVLKALEKRPGNRFQQAKDLRDEVTRITTSSPSEDVVRSMKTADSVRGLLAGGLEIPHIARTPTYSAATFFWLVPTAACAAGAVAFEDWRTVFSIVGAIPCLFFLWHLMRETLVSNNRSTPQDAVKSYFGSIRWELWRRAYEFLSPLDKTSRLRKLPELRSLTLHPRKFAFDTLAGFREYWRAVTSLPRGAAFSESYKWMRWQLDGIDMLSERVARAHVTLKVMGIPRWLGLAQFVVIFGSCGLGLIIALFLSVACRKSDYVTAEKLLYRHEGRWYVLNGEVSSSEDKLDLQ